ncbi:hypothetical protein ACOSQ2_014550 [Xanthoceras sorbifolium]
MSQRGESSRAAQRKKRSRPLRVNPKFRERMKKFEKRAILLERDIDVEAMEGTMIPEVIGARQWNHFVQHPNYASERLVREFYTSMIPDDYFAWGMVVVQGQQITLTPKIVNEFYGLPDVPQAPGGLEEHMFFTAWSQDLTGSLRMDGSGCWVFHECDLYHSQLRLETAFWHVLCDSSILPKTHRTTITLPMAGINKNVVGGTILKPKKLFSRPTYNKLAHQRNKQGFQPRRGRQGADQANEGDEDMKQAPQEQEPAQISVT